MNTFTAVTLSPTQVTVSPLTSSGVFTATEPTTNTMNNTATSITVADSAGHTVSVPVGFNLICL